MISVSNDSLNLLVQKNLNSASNRVNTALERMSTGYKVNQAKDDAANMVISERLKTGIRASKVLRNGASNALDMLNIMDGAFNNITNSLMRIRDLSLQKLNGTYDTNSIEAMNEEIKQQTANIDQICANTNFNGKYLLNGSTTSIQVPLYDNGNTVNSIEISGVFGVMDAVNVLAGRKDLFFIDAEPGKSYYAEFDDKVFEIKNNGNALQELIYNYNPTSQSIQFVEGENCTATEIGTYNNNFIQLGNGEKYLNMNANTSYYIQSGNKVYELKNTNSDSQIAIFNDDNAGNIDILSGNGITQTFMYDLDSYTSISSGQSLTLTAGSSQHVLFQNKLYEITSTKDQTLIFNNSGGNLNALAGTDGVTINKIANMETGVTTGLSRYMSLAAGQTVYYEFNGELFQVTNNKSTSQNFILDSNNNIKDNNEGNITRTKLSKANISDFSSYQNLQKMDVTQGQSYYLQNENGSGVTKITANETGTIYFDKISSGYTNFQGVSVSTSAIEAVTPDSNNQFQLTVSGKNSKTFAIGDSVFTVNNTDTSSFTKTFEYDPSAKTVTEVVENTSDFINAVQQLSEDEAVAQGYTVIKTAAELDNIRNNLSGKYILMNDIDLSSISNWNSIGGEYNSFSGVLNGNGYAIKNLTSNRADQRYVGLFGYSKGASFLNLGLENVYINADSDAGAITGCCESTEFTNCYVTGRIINGGGIVGEADGGNNKITYCYTDCTITGDFGLGGLASSFSGSIENSYTKGNITSTSYEVGGLAGYFSGTIVNCYTTGDISGYDDTNSPYTAIGGIVGRLGDGTISNVFSTGDIEHDGNSGYGITGFNQGTIKNAFWNYSKNLSWGVNSSGNSTATNAVGLSEDELADKSNWSGWDESVWDFSTCPPTLKNQSLAGISCTFEASTVTPTAVTNKSDYLLLDNFFGTTYTKYGDSIYEIKNTGSSKDVIFETDASGNLSCLTSDVTLTKLDSASFNSLGSSNFSKTIASGATQYMAFTIGGVQRVYKVTNNSSDSQSVIYSKTNNVSIVSGENVLIEEITDMNYSSAIGANSFYIDFAGETSKNINVNGKFYEITNNSGTTALFQISGNNIVQKSGSTASFTSKIQSNASNTSSNQYYVEMNGSEERYIKKDGTAFKLTNNTAGVQTQIFSQSGTSLNSVSGNVSSLYLPMSNDPMQQGLIISDWVMDEVTRCRASIGAYMNVIEASITRNTIVEESLTAANSTIMDADIAQESAEMVQARILQDVTSALLSQVNRIQGDLVLRLLS